MSTSSRPDLADALEAAAQRKRSLFVEEGEESDADVGVGIAQEEGLRLLCVGLDLEVDEVMAASDLQAKILGMTVVATGVPVFNAISGAWVDGLITGVLLAQLREGSDDA